jgi:response regulator RpfG family c-di-GMP phosphodiesterase
VHARNLLMKIKPYQDAIQIPYYHHENWDGSGYPRGLKGKQIPIEARIFQVVETWVHMLVDLPYRTAHDKSDAMEYIRSQAGMKFDPQVVDIFLRIKNSEIGKERFSKFSS